MGQGLCALPESLVWRQKNKVDMSCIQRTLILFLKIKSRLNIKTKNILFYQISKVHLCTVVVCQSCGVDRRRELDLFIRYKGDFFYLFFHLRKLINTGFRYFIKWIQDIFPKLHCWIFKILLSVYNSVLLSFTAVKFLG